MLLALWAAIVIYNRFILFHKIAKTQIIAKHSKFLDIFSNNKLIKVTTNQDILSIRTSETMPVSAAQQFPSVLSDKIYK